MGGRPRIWQNIQRAMNTTPHIPALSSFYCSQSKRGVPTLRNQCLHSLLFSCVHHRSTKAFSFSQSKVQIISVIPHIWNKLCIINVHTFTFLYTLFFKWNVPKSIAATDHWHAGCYPTHPNRKQGFWGSELEALADEFSSTGCSSCKSTAPFG